MKTNTSFAQLAGLGGRAIAGRLSVDDARRSLPLASQECKELVNLLTEKNGFYAFESALHIFPFSPTECDDQQELLQWNLEGTWKYQYPPIARGVFCFAEDIFGCQFCFRDGHVARFDPETGDCEFLSPSLEEWARLVLEDPEGQVGSSLAHRWQNQKGPIRSGHRLVPIIPLVTSEGSYELNNFYEVPALKGMLSRADFARQIRLVPDGTKIRLVPTNAPKADD